MAAIEPIRDREAERNAPCPECGTVLLRLLRGGCLVCGVYLIPTEGMPAARPARRAYKQDADSTWRLVWDPATPERFR